MFSFKLGLKNLTRQKRRNILIIFVIAFAFSSYLLMDSLMNGIKEEVFDTDFPDEAAKLIFEMAYIFSERIPKLLLGNDKNLDEAEKKFRVYENAIERIIGAEEGTVKIVNRNVLKDFSEKIKN